MRASLEDALTDPQFDALSIVLAGFAEGDAESLARDALQTALIQVLGQTAANWTIQAIHPDDSGAYDLLPPPDLVLSVSQAFDVKYALEAHPAIDSIDALFETNLDNVPEPAPSAGESPELERAGADWFSNLTPAEQDPLWSLRLIKAASVWDRTEGAGITIGHPDSGYMPHAELDDGRIRHDEERDFYDNDADARNPQDRGGNHGLSTASVILSGRYQSAAERFVNGVAPGAMIIPMRITRKGPPVFLFRSGPRRVRRAILHAIDCECDIISMSLGGIGEASLQRAVQAAVKQNIIVLAAAGNGVPFVVWPARYPETIAVAACTVDRGRWSLSSHGPTVDVTAPGHNVWRAYIDEDGREAVKPSSGTSYAVATVAGAAALWVALHGRQQLLQKYEGTGIVLNDVFRKVLAMSCDSPPVDHGGQFGAGIINVQQLLDTPLPQAGAFEADQLEGMVSVSIASTPVGAVAAVFDTVSAEAVRERLAKVTAVPADELDTTLAGVEDELLFHIVTNPELRQAMTGDSPAIDGVEALDSAGSSLLAAVPGLSGDLRGRLAVAPQ